MDIINSDGERYTIYPRWTSCLFTLIISWVVCKQGKCRRPILYTLKTCLELFELTESKISVRVDYDIPFPFYLKKKKKGNGKHTTCGRPWHWNGILNVFIHTTLSSMHQPSLVHMCWIDAIWVEITTCGKSCLELVWIIKVEGKSVLLITHTLQIR